MTPPTTISRALADYLTDWLAWVDRGAPDGEPYRREDGLCCASFDGPFGRKRLHRELRRLFETDTPFGDDYGDRYKSDTQHLNEARLAWCRSTLATAEITE